MRPIHSVAAGLALLATVTAPAIGEDAPSPKRGATGVALTVVGGSEIREIPLRYLGVYDGFGGPGFDVHIVELDGPEALEVGIANGMSGSPVYIDGQLIGALAFRLGSMPKKPVAGVTPLAAMRAASRAGPSVGAPAGGGLVPIATPVLAGGMPEAIRRWLAPELAPFGFVLVPGGGAGGADEGGEPPALRPGSPVGIDLVRGDMTIAATGTVTFVEGDQVFAFGHPFLGSGRVEMPMVAAEVVHTVADAAGSFRLTNVGREMGAIVEDRAGAVVGRLDRRARMIPIDVVLRGADYGEQSFHYEMIPHARLAPLLAGAVVASSLRTAGYSQEATLIARGQVRLRGLAPVPLEMAFSTGSGSDPTVSVATEILFTMSSLGLNSHQEIDIEGIEIEVDASLTPVTYTVEDVHYDRGTLDPGAPLRVRCVLRKYRGGTEVREITVPLPASISDRSDLVLVVGSPMLVDEALGNPIIERLRSAVDLDSVVGVLREPRSSHRLTFVVYRSGGAVVSRGSAYSDLPPTAERLLGAQRSSGNAVRGSLVSPIARADVALDGPVRGGVRLRLRVERDRGGED